MARRTAARAFVATGLLLAFAVPSGAAETLLPQIPDKDCAERVADPAGDGHVNWHPSGELDDPRGSLDPLDITGVTVRVTATRVIAFMALKDIPTAMRPTDTAYGYYMWFTYGAKTARFQHVLVNSNQSAIGPGGFPTGSVGTGTNGGTNPLRGLGADVDSTHDVVYVYADRAALEEELGEPLPPGAKLTAITGKTVLFVGAGSAAAGVTQRPADATEVAADKAVYTIGADPCFAPSVVTTASTSAQYGDPAQIVVGLTDVDEEPLVDKRITVTLPGEAPRTATTNEDGEAFLSVPARTPGTFTVTYDGDETSGAGTGRGTVAVRPEVVRFAALKVVRSGTARTVTATLTEDDPRPCVRLPVDFYVNGRKVATVLTDSKGRAVFKGATAGQKVQARYAGATGRYAAAKSATVTV
ncbi:MAG TPA: hypothetical protein VNQ77_04250 [Frankiaceae bacterium]|nr:hypothetical protein [Frankiaceae bacterium]